ncbi:hypothetical protein FHG87_013955 [Trinorchestia longiramus]|nr:hypothetical protein FHG87_013955 [Trinorchestia longiramus]
MPKKPFVTPKRTFVTPKRTFVTPKRTFVTPKRTFVTPKSTLVTPKSTLVTPESTLVTPKSTLMMPKSTLVTPKSTLVCVGTQCGEVLVHDLRSLRAPLHTWSAHPAALTALAPQPIPTGSLRKRKTPSTSHKLNKSLPDDSPQETEPRHYNPLPTPKDEASVSRVFVPSSLEDLSADILSPVRDSASTHESNIKMTTGPSVVTTLGRTMVQDELIVRKGKLVCNLLSHPELDSSVKFSQEGAAAFDPDDILSPVRAAADDDSTLTASFASSGQRLAVRGMGLGCSPALGSRGDDDSMRPSLLRKAPVESRHAVGSDSQLSNRESPAVSSSSQLARAKFTISSTQRLAGLNSVTSSPQQIALDEAKITTSLVKKNSLQPHLDASKYTLPIVDREFVPAETSSVESSTNTIPRMNTGHTFEASRSLLLDGEKETNSPAPSLHSLADDLFSPLRDAATTLSSSVLSSKKIGDRIAVIEDLIKSRSPQTTPSRRNNSRCGDTSSLSPHNKENVPAMAPLSPSFDPPSSRNVTLNDSNLSKCAVTATSTAATGTAANSNTINSTQVPGTGVTTESDRAVVATTEAAPAVTSQSLTLALVQSCVTDALEEFETSVNRRFMHLHYTLLTTLVQQTREIEELHKKYSINEELLQENLRLQEEIRHLRANY